MKEEDTTAGEPLMQDNSHPEEEPPVRSRGSKDVEIGAGAFVYALTFAAGVSGLLFGYE